MQDSHISENCQLENVILDKNSFVRPGVRLIGHRDYPVVIEKRSGFNMDKIKVLFASSEVSPFIKVGGLADVVGALPVELNKNDVDARVILPCTSRLR